MTTISKPHTDLLPTIDQRVQNGIDWLDTQVAKDEWPMRINLGKLKSIAAPGSCILGQVFYEAAQSEKVRNDTFCGGGYTYAYDVLGLSRHKGFDSTAAFGFSCRPGEDTPLTAEWQRRVRELQRRIAMTPGQP